MAQEDVVALIRRAVTDDTFRLALSRDFDAAVEVSLLRLTDEETEALKKLSFEGPLPGSIEEGRWVHIYES